MGTFKEILDRKIEYYGKTEAAYEFAAEEYAIKLYKEYQALQLHKTQVSGSVCDKDDDFEPIIKHFRSEDTPPNWDDKPMGGFSDW